MSVLLALFVALVVVHAKPNNTKEFDRIQKVFRTEQKLIHGDDDRIEPAEVKKRINFIDINIYIYYHYPGCWCVQ